jgi:hypothetical protein
MLSIYSLVVLLYLEENCEVVHATQPNIRQLVHGPSTPTFYFTSPCLPLPRATLRCCARSLLHFRRSVARVGVALAPSPASPRLYIVSPPLFRLPTTGRPAAPPSEYVHTSCCPACHRPGGENQQPSKPTLFPQLGRGAKEEYSGEVDA